jgi:hypothetical protein
MEDSNSLPFFKKIDHSLFERIDKFKQTSNYTPLQDFYNGLEEEQQSVFKVIIIATIFIVPLGLLGFFFWQNNLLKDDLEMRVNIVSKASEIIGQHQGLKDITPRVFSTGPIENQSMLTSRLSNIVSAMGVDLAKIQVRDFSSEPISNNVMRTEADFSFTNFSTDELMNLFTAMIQREKFRISAVEIKRNADNNMLQGQFHAIHFSTMTSAGDEEQD